MCGFLCERQQVMDFSLEEVLLLIEDSFFSWKQQFEGKTSWWICFFCLLMMSTDELEWCGLLWCFYQLFGLSFWRHPFTAEDPLVSKWWNATFLQIWWRNKLIYILDSTISPIFGWTILSRIWSHALAVIANNAPWPSLTHTHFLSAGSWSLSSCTAVRSLRLNLCGSCSKRPAVCVWSQMLLCHLQTTETIGRHTHPGHAN